LIIFHLKPTEDKMGEEFGEAKNLKDKTEELMSKKELVTKISKKKGELAPVLKDLKSLREAIDVTSNQIRQLFLF
jgi:hypothetical protein